MIAILNWSGGMSGATQVVGIFPSLLLAKEWVETNYSWKKSSLRYVEFDFGEVEFDYDEAESLDFNTLFT